jgi:tetratricopeptide (TPR) repeat protein
MGSIWLLLLPALFQTDSAAALERAREAQAEFERIRIAHLPRVYAGSRTRCDEVVGRFCFWHGDEEEEDSWEPPPEPARIKAARKRLIDVLDSVARAFPGDDWTAGQLVRYLVEDGRSNEAVPAANRCRATAWWCRALLGYALHWSGEFTKAEAAFEQALGLMPERERCAWEDLSPLLEGSYGFYRRASCEERRLLERRIWWLADPFFSVPGNERRTEHLARRVMDRMQERAHSAYGFRWGSDLRELLVRYGWPVAWARDESAAHLDATRPVIIAYNAPRGRRFIPPGEVVLDPGASDESWELKPDFPRSTYAVPYARRLEPAEAQLVAFLRGDSVIVVGAYDLSVSRHQRAGRRNPKEPNPVSGNGGGEEIEAALAISANPGEPPLIVRHRSGSGRGVLAAFYPGTSGVVSLELLSRTDSTAYRARRWIAMPKPASGITLSEPLLFSIPRADSLPRSLAEVLPSALGAARIAEGEGVGVYWEIYSAKSDAVSVGVSLSREVGVIGRLGAALGIGSSKRDRVELDWPDRVDARRPVSHSVWLSLPQFQDGTYRLEVKVLTSSGERVRTARALRIERRR